MLRCLYPASRESRFCWGGSCWILSVYCLLLVFLLCRGVCVRPLGRVGVSAVFVVPVELFCFSYLWLLLFIESSSLSGLQGESVLCMLLCSFEDLVLLFFPSYEGVMSACLRGETVLHVAIAWGVSSPLFLLVGCPLVGLPVFGFDSNLFVCNLRVYVAATGFPSFLPILILVKVAFCNGISSQVLSPPWPHGVW